MLDSVLSRSCSIFLDFSVLYFFLSFLSFIVFLSFLSFIVFLFFLCFLICFFLFYLFYSLFFLFLSFLFFLFFLFFIFALFLSLLVLNTKILLKLDFWETCETIDLECPVSGLTRWTLCMVWDLNKTMAEIILLCLFLNMAQFLITMCRLPVKISSFWSCAHAQLQNRPI